MYRIPLVREFRESGNALRALLREKSERYWIERGRIQALRLYREMAERVPAYRAFLKEHGIANPASIRDYRDLEKIPIASKDNYLRRYPLESLCWDGTFKKGRWVIASTSGSTGQPFYFPRTAEQDEHFGLTAEMNLSAYFDIGKKSTLFVNCFAMGVWIGGIFVYQATKHILERGKHDFAVITPGADKGEALKAVRNLGPKVDQVILCGYGPLIKDLIDEGIAQGIDWSALNMKYLFAAEGFTEGFRDYMHDRGGAKDIYGGTINMYGTADLGAMAHETPISIYIRRSLVKRPEIYPRIFSHRRLPTFAQYIPELYFFEEVDTRLICSSPGGIPLMRYDLKDVGQVHGFDETLRILAEEGIEVGTEMREYSIGHEVWNLPFVSVFERNDLTVSIYSVNIYPESIKKALEGQEMQGSLTGKFTMVVDFDQSNNQYLEINIELLQEARESAELRRGVLESIIRSLSNENSEWKDFYMKEDIKHKVIPRISFWPYQDPKYFKAGTKQKWVKKQPQQISSTT